MLTRAHQLFAVHQQHLTLAAIAQLQGGHGAALGNLRHLHQPFGQCHVQRQVVRGAGARAQQRHQGKVVSATGRAEAKGSERVGKLVHLRFPVLG